MSITKGVIALLLCLFVFYTHAQPPSGYMGKRLSVNYNFISIPNLYQAVAAEANFKLHTTHELNLEYILTRNSSLGLFGAYYNADILYYAYDANSNTGYYGHSGYYYGDNNASNYDDYTTTGRLSAEDLGLFYRLYHNKNTAPVGGYSQVELHAIIHQLYPTTVVYDFDVTETEVYDNNTGYYNYEYQTTPKEALGKDNYGSMMLAYTIGVQRIWFDRVIMRFGFRMGYVFGGFKVSKDETFNSFRDAFGTGLNEYNYVKRISKRALFDHNLFNVTLGIGFLAL
ncbi:MAG: hypothetical protein COA57_10745 [Flavobacteriales bacterium]|nr:MAG: hypothetical protein COA57_10745 [Flavobacteriales bacterium]